MIKRWKELDELPCVKRFGIKHKIAHFIGTASVTHCLMAHIGEGIREGFIEEKEGWNVCDNYPYDSDDDILDYFDDTAECPSCGAYYCLCCGCDCLLGLYEDEEDE